MMVATSKDLQLCLGVFMLHVRTHTHVCLCEGGMEGDRERGRWKGRKEGERDKE